MSIDPACPDCTRCQACGRPFCPGEEVSPGEASGLCVTCWLTEDPEDEA